MKKRILQLIGSFNQGGSERQAVSLTRLLDDEGSFEVFAATLDKTGGLRSEIESIGLPAIPEFPLTLFYNPNFVRQVRRCAQYLKENSIGLVHTHDFYTNIFGMAAATLAGVSARIASKRETGGMRTRAQEFIEGAAFGRASAIVVNSAAVHEHLIDRKFSSEKIKLIYNGIDGTRFGSDQTDRNEARARFALPMDDNVRFIIMVANLRHEIKNVPMLLRTAKIVADRSPNAHFVIAGEGELESQMKENARSLGVAENVHFIGLCTDIPALLLLADVCVLTSRAEGFSNSILEYMAAGKPVIATNVGGAAEAVEDGKTGYLVPSDDADAMAAKVIDLLAEKEKAMVFGAAGRKIVSENFSQESQLRKTLDLYRSVLTR